MMLRTTTLKPQTYSLRIVMTNMKLQMQTKYANKLPKLWYESLFLKIIS